MKLFEWYKAWRKRRYWKARHLEFLRAMIDDDYRWLAHEPLARKLADRYKRAASNNWYTLSHEPISDFRTRLGLDPDYNNKH